MNAHQAKYFGRAVTMLLIKNCNDININTSYEECSTIAWELEEAFRSSKANWYLYKDMYENAWEAKWKKYFEGVGVGVKDGLSLKNLKVDNSHQSKWMTSEVMQRVSGVTKNFLKTYTPSLKRKLATGEIIDSEQYKIYNLILVCNFKLKKKKNDKYMKGIVEDLGKKVAGSGEILASVGQIIEEEFSTSVVEYHLDKVGVSEIPDTLIGQLPDDIIEKEEEAEIIEILQAQKNLESQGINLNVIKNSCQIASQSNVLSELPDIEESDDFNEGS